MVGSAGVESQEIIDALGLEPNPAGGWFRSVHQVEAPDRGRPVANAINFLVDASTPIIAFHRMSADALHFFHRGDPLAVITLSPVGVLERSTLGADLARGHQLQVLVPGDHWKAFELIGDGWSLISEAVAPGWIPEDQDLADASLYERDFPHLRDEIERLV